MGCIYHGWGRNCDFYEEDMGDVKHIDDTDYGFTVHGDCVVEDDEDPARSCSAYESNDPEDEDYEEDEEESEYTLEALDAELDTK